MRLRECNSMNPNQIPDHRAQIIAMLGSGKMVRIGGRPVIVPEPKKRASAHDRGLAIKLALAFVAIYVVWGSTYLAIRYAVETIPPLIVAGFRHIIAGVFLLGWAYFRGFRPTRSEWRASAVLGFLYFVLGHGSLHWAETVVPSGWAALLIASEPIWIAVMAAL